MIDIQVTHYTPSDLHPMCLEDELANAGVEYLKLTYDGLGGVDIVTDGPPNGSLAAVIAAHPVLSGLKKHRKAEIDAKTQDLIRQGFVHASKVFSLSTNAQINWTNMGFAAGNLSYPYRVATKDDLDYHDFADTAEMQTAYGIALITKSTHLATGTALKDQIEAATTVAEVDAVVDNR